METFDDNENQDILKALEKSSSNADFAFKESLKTKVISTYRAPFESRFNFFAERNLNFLSVFIVVLSVGFITSAGLATLGNNQTVSNQSVSRIPAAETSNIIESIVKNNPEILIAQDLTTESVSNFEDTESLTLKLQEVVNDSSQKNYNYSYTKSSFELGEKSSVCKTLTSTNIESQEIYTFSKENGDFLYRVINRDKDDNILDSIQLNNNNLDSVETLYTKGGDFVVAINSTSILSDAIQVSVPIEQNKYFDSNISELEEVTNNAESFYVINTQTQTDCEGKSLNLIYKKWFNTSDFSLIKIEIYLEDANDESNLIKRTIFSVVTQEIDFEEVKANFQTIADNISIINISNQSKLEAMNLILTNHLDVITGNAVVKNASIADFEQIVSMDRKFYATNLEYTNFINSNVVPIITYLIEDDVKINVEVYNQDVFDFNIVKGDFDTQEINTLSVGGLKVKGKIFTPRVPLSSPEELSSTRYLLFNYNNYKYLLKSEDIDKIVNRNFNIVGFK